MPCGRFGIEEPDLDRLTPFIGPPLKDSFMEMYGFNEKQAEEAIDKYREWFRPTGIFQNAIYPGIREMLEKLKMQGKVLGRSLQQAAGICGANTASL